MYLFEDLAKRDFDAVLKLAEDKTITVEGVVLVQKDTDGELHVSETGDHLGRKGLKLGGGAGLVVGLFAPPLLAATAVGAAAGGVVAKFAKHRVESGIAEKMDDALPPGAGGVIAIYDSGGRRHGRQGAPQRGQEIRGADRRHQRQGAQIRAGGSSGWHRRLNLARAAALRFHPAWAMRADDRSDLIDAR